MKHLLLMALLCCFTLFSCEKNDSSISQPKYKNLESFYEFEEGFQLALNASTENDLIKVEFEPSIGYTFSIYPNPDYPPVMPPQDKVRCTGSGVSFAKCVKNAVDKYGCQKITKSDDDYISSDC